MLGGPEVSSSGVLSIRHSSGTETGVFNTTSLLLGADPSRLTEATSTVVLRQDGSAQFGKASNLGGATIFDLQTEPEGGQLQVLGVKTGSSFVSKYVSGSNGHHFIGKYDDTFNYIVDHLGNTKIGGTLPSAPNITLNANGSALFAGSVNFSEFNNNLEEGRELK